jgi:hypothetical protein
LKKLLFLSLIITSLCISQESAQAQLFKKKKDKPPKEKKDKKSKKKKGDTYQGFNPGQAPLTPEQRQNQMTSQWRKILNMFNFSIEKGYGYFDYQNELTGVSVVRNPRGDLLYIVPSGEATGQGPFNAYSNWFNDLTPLDITRIDDDSEIVNTDTTNFVYRNNGRINPFTLRLSFSLRKVDKQHLKRTGERRMTDNELLRIGGGISFGKLKFRNQINTQDINPRLRSFSLPVTEVSTTKMFGSVTYNAYRYGDLSLLVDLSGGVWKTKNTAFNQSIIKYDPFFNVGVIFEQRISKYFKVYIRPSFEVRQYSISNDAFAVPHKFSVFSIDIGALIKYPIYPRNKYKAHRVQMEHIFNGKIYRGRSIFARQNPRTGQFGKSRKDRVRIGGN